MKCHEMTSYKVVDSKSGLKVPIVNGVSLHSIYDPAKEARELLWKYRDSLAERSEVMVLGLGFGHHIVEIVKFFEQAGRSYSISVIEPNKRVVADCLKLNQLDLKFINIYCNPSVRDLFCHKDLVNFLIKRPVVIPHPHSFNLYRQYFTQYLTYKNPQGLKEALRIIDNRDVQHYFDRFVTEGSFQKSLENIMNRPQVDDDFEFALIAFENFLSEGTSKIGQ